MAKRKNYLILVDHHNVQGYPQVRVVFNTTVSLHNKCDRLRFDPYDQCPCPRISDADLDIYPVGDQYAFNLTKRSRKRERIFSGVGIVEVLGKAIDLNVYYGVGGILPNDNAVVKCINEQIYRRSAA